MPAGVEGFVPGRLTMAREARGLRQRELAAAVERSDATISKYENADRPQKPEPGLLPKLAEVLRVDVSWFFKPLPHQRTTTAFFRSLIGELEQMRDKARARLGFVEAIEEVLSHYIDFPEVDVPNLLEGRDYRTLRREDFESYAADLRRHWNLGDGPIDDLLLVIENAGIILAEDQIGSVKLDGVSLWSEASRRPYMLVAQDKNVGVRRRLDAAHELAHLVLHQDVTPELLLRDFRLIEEQAMAFAGALLLPSESFADDVFSHSLEALVGLKTKWKVSVGAMIKRLSHMGNISEQYERRLWQYYSYRKWRTREPFDDVIPIEQPQNLKEAIEIIVNNNELSRRELLREIGLHGEDVCSLTGVEPNTFEEWPSTIVRLKPARKQDEDAEDSGNVIPFSERTPRR